MSLSLSPRCPQPQSDYAVPLRMRFSPPFYDSVARLSSFDLWICFIRFSTFSW